MVRRMGLRDLGTNYDNLAVLRPTWMPSILCEGAFVMMPDQEALLRTAEFQEAYALGVVEGVESYFQGDWSAVAVEAGGGERAREVGLTRSREGAKGAGGGRPCAVTFCGFAASREPIASSAPVHDTRAAHVQSLGVRFSSTQSALVR
jgi:hypothetical protein